LENEKNLYTWNASLFYKNMHKILILILGLIIPLSFVHAIKPIPTNTVKITNPDKSTTTITLPLALTGKALETVNTYIKDLIPEDVKTPYIPNSEFILDTANYEYQFDVEKLYSNTQFTSIKLTYYGFTGGAHGNTSYIGLVIDNTTGKIYELKDFFQVNKLVRRLSPIWQKQIQKEFKESEDTILSEVDLEWIREGTDSADDYSSFALTDKELIIYGQPYQHTAYAYGTFDLNYRLTLLRTLRVMQK
jgi:Protein of unknown function (DUF3298)/Deacetylase PdaC